jgi:hypothetical protein
VDHEFGERIPERRESIGERDGAAQEPSAVSGVGAGGARRDLGLW